MNANKSKVWIGIDNGVSGSIACISYNGDTKKYSHEFMKTPTFSSLNYQKTKVRMVTRIHAGKLRDILAGWTACRDSIAILERPMVNPRRWGASMSAIRCLEATLVVIEGLKIPYQYMDSKQWQKAMMPRCREDDDTKKASLNVGMRLFPKVDPGKHGDLDSLLMAEYARRQNY